MAEPPKELCDAIAKGRALLVCGAGVSQAATGGVAPGWKPLIEAAREAARDQIAADAAWLAACNSFLDSKDASQWLRAADIVQEELGGVGDQRYGAFLRNMLVDLKCVNAALLDAVAKCAASGNRIATTNYDHLISHHLGWERVDWTQPAYHAVEALKNRRPAVWHIHGDFSSPQSVVFSKSDYERVKAHEFAQFVQRLAALELTFVFVGCSGSGLADENVGRLLSWLRAGFAGLGDKHFALTTDDNKDPWPAGVTVVRVGERKDLPAYLAKLAPEPVTATPFPLDPYMIGRVKRREELVAAILGEDRPVIVPGGPGMGKTTLALAAAYDPGVVRRFGERRRFFVLLDAVPDADGVLRRLAVDLGLAATGASTEIEAAIAAACSAQPTLVILDNFETPLAKDGGASEALLGRLAAMNGLRLVVTVRGQPPRVAGRGARTLLDVPRLSNEEAKTLFLRHAGDHFEGDLALPELLRALDGHPLSVELVAAHAAGGEDLKDVLGDLNTRGPDVFGLGSGRLSSVSVSIGLSLDALGAASPARRLIRVMALLPDGMSDVDSQTILSDGVPASEERVAASRLKDARLASRTEGRWRLLGPIRDTVYENYPPEPMDRARLMRRFLSYAALGKKVGTPEWGNAKVLLVKEAGNLDEIIGAEVNQPKLSSDLLEAADGLAKFHSATGLASTQSLSALADRFRRTGNFRGEALCNEFMGDVALARFDHKGAIACFETALPLFAQIEDRRGKAVCIERLGDIAYAQAKYEKAAKHFGEARLLFKQIGNVGAEAGCFERQGDVAIRRAKLQEAKKNFRKGLDLFRIAQYMPGEAGCLQRLGDVASRLFCFEEAVKDYIQASQVYGRIDDVRGRAGCAERLGDVALNVWKLQDARKSYLEALRLSRQIRDLGGQAGAHQRLGGGALRSCEFEYARRLFDELGESRDDGRRRDDFVLRRCQLAQQRYSRALQLYKDRGDARGEGGCLRGLGDVALARSEFDGAAALYKNARDVFKRVNDMQGEAACTERLGEIALALSDHRLARAQYVTALKFFQDSRDVLGKANCIRGLGNVHEATREFAAARERWREAIALYAKIRNLYWLSLTHLSLARRAEAAEDAAQHREAAYQAWESILRPGPRQVISQRRMRQRPIPPSRRATF